MHTDRRKFMLQLERDSMVNKSRKTKSRILPFWQQNNTKTSIKVIKGRTTKSSPTHFWQDMKINIACPDNNLKHDSITLTKIKHIKLNPPLENTSCTGYTSLVVYDFIINKIILYKNISLHLESGHILVHLVQFFRHEIISFLLNHDSEQNQWNSI